MAGGEISHSSFNPFQLARTAMFPLPLLNRLATLEKVPKSQANQAIARPVSWIWRTSRDRRVGLKHTHKQLHTQAEKIQREKERGKESNSFRFLAFSPFSGRKIRRTAVSRRYHTTCPSLEVLMNRKKKFHAEKQDKVNFIPVESWKKGDVTSWSI